uniref:Uncharacterized protein LOC100368340 n=1 Tax=Saccoglossus kowalevskii TaxID=10224 RepID=A0ABM0MJY4_SACKO|nr:PREDICTED: uncharacterized protein LOC100368340 [Saccoglossus kowalevskii]
MARNATESLCRRNPKLDTFLKRKLSANVYDRIRAYEECIISSEKEKRAFKHVVLSDERIYLTENPPKNITEDDSVPLEEITSVEMVHDYPDFLVGEERDNTQHISVVYTTAISSKLKKKEKNNKKKEPSELKNDNTSTMGTPRPTTPPSARSNDWRSTLTNSTPLSRKTGNKLRYSLNETELHKLASSSESTDEDRLSLSLPTSDFKKLSQNGDYYSDDDYDDDDIREQIEEYQRFSEDLTTQMLPCRPLPVRPEDNPDEYPSIDTARSYSSSLATTLRNPQESSEALEAKPLYRNLPHPGGNEYNPLDRRKAEPFKLSLTETGELTTPRSLRQEVILDKGKQGKKKKKKTEKKNQKAKQTTTMQLTLTNGDDSTSGEDRVTSEQVIYGSNHTKTAEIHIYILSLSSPFMMQLQCAWNNYIIRATLSLKKNSNDNFGAKNNKKLSR